MNILLCLLGAVLITVAFTIICYFVGDENWLHALLYVLSSYAILAMFGIGIACIIWGTS